MPDLGPFQLDTIVAGNCLDVMRQMPDGCVDLIVADPPYGAKGRATWDSWAGTDWIAPMPRLLRSGGSAYVFMGYTNAPDTASALRKVLTERTWVIWWKRNSALSQVKCWKSQHEIIFYLVKPGADYIWNRWDILEPFDTKGGEKDSPHSGKVPGNVWQIPGVNWCSKERTAHPTQKPVSVLDRIIRASSVEGDTIFDPFIGSGTTAVAAKKLGRHYFGCDINPEYVEMARARVAKIDGVQLELAV